MFGSGRDIQNLQVLQLTCVSDEGWLELAQNPLNKRRSICC
jgi:hypothetical protein